MSGSPYSEETSNFKYRSELQDIHHWWAQKNHLVSPHASGKWYRANAQVVLHNVQHILYSLKYIEWAQLPRWKNHSLKRSSRFCLFSSFHFICFVADTYIDMFYWIKVSYYGITRCSFSRVSDNFEKHIRAIFFFNLIII